MVFTGIVEEIGVVVSNRLCDSVRLWDGSVGQGWMLTVRASTVLDGAYNGCSIAVNGTCLTVTEFTREEFTVGLAPETLLRTNLGELASGDPVNLERSMKGDARNSGHNVQGHVDGTGTILVSRLEGYAWEVELSLHVPTTRCCSQEMKPDRESLRVRIAAPPELLRLIVPKGYVSIDGASLTVIDVVPPAAPGAAGAFSVMLIAYTQQHITLPRKRVGGRVNLEVDVVGKYLDRSAAALLQTVVELGGRLDGALAGLASRIDELEARMMRVERAAASAPGRGSAAPELDA